MLHPANAYLGPRGPLDRDPIGYHVLDLNRAPVLAFTAERVISDMPGWYAVTGGVDVPATGGYIVWGTATRDMAEESIPPMPELPTQALISGVQAALRELGNRMAKLIPPPPVIPAPVVQMDTGPFEGRIAELRSDLLAQATAAQAAANERDAERTQALTTALATIQEFAAVLAWVEDAGERIVEMADIVGRVSGALDDAGVIHVVTEMNTERLAELRVELAQVQADAQRALAELQADAHRRATVAALDEFLAAVGG